VFSPQRAIDIARIGDVMTAFAPTETAFPTTDTVIRARIATLPASFLTRVRTEGLDDLGQSVKHVIAGGGEPCRDVLRRARPGEELILASHSPFTKPGPYKEYGPVFVLARESEETVQDDAMAAGAETDYLRAQFVIRAYSDQDEILDAALVVAGDAQRTIDRFFARSDVSYLHVRFPTYGCFACRLDRAEVRHGS
jgi:hypothetical protein